MRVFQGSGDTRESGSRIAEPRLHDQLALPQAGIGREPLSKPRVQPSELASGRASAEIARRVRASFFEFEAPQVHQMRGFEETQLRVRAPGSSDCHACRPSPCRASTAGLVKHDHAILGHPADGRAGQMERRHRPRSARADWTR